MPAKSEYKYADQIKELLEFQASKHEETAQLLRQYSNAEWDTDEGGEISIGLSIVDQEIEDAMFLLEEFYDPKDNLYTKLRTIQSETTSNRLYDLTTNVLKSLEA